MTRIEDFEASLSSAFDKLQFAAEGLSKDEIASTLVNMLITRDEDREMDEADQMAILYATANNMTVITARSQKGRMSIASFDGIHSIWTGLANPCVSALVSHPAIGAGGAHLKTTTKDHIVRYFRHTLDLSRNEFIKALMPLQNTDLDTFRRMLVPINDRKLSIKNAISLATTEFKSLMPNQNQSLPKGTTISLTGLTYSTPEETMRLRQSAQDYCSLLGRGIKCEPYYIGMKGGIAYGGLMHPEFSQPTFVTL